MSGPEPMYRGTKAGLLSPFRIFLFLLFCACAATFVWLASHDSENPEILGRYSREYAVMLGIAGAVVLASLACQIAPFYGWLEARRKELLLLGVSVTVTVAALEIALRGIDPLGISYFEESSRYHREKLPDPDLVFKHAPDSQRVYQGVTIRTNRLGLRDREVGPKAPREMRILLLGDSVTLGWGVDAEDTFARRLEPLLSERLGRPVRTINAGVGGYNTAQEYEWFRRDGADLDVDAVVLTYVENDYEDPLPPPDQPIGSGSPPEAMLNLLKASWIYRVALLAGIRGGGMAPSDRASAAMVRPSNVIISRAESSMRHLAAISRLAQDRQLPFITFFYRPRPEQVPAAQLELQVSLLAAAGEVGRENGFPVFDMGHWWGERDMRMLTNSALDPHPNADGHALMAEHMARDIAETLNQSSSQQLSLAGH